MGKFVPFHTKDLNQLVNIQSHNTNLGEQIQLLPYFTNIYDDIVNLDVDYVIFGIKEELGEFANNGKSSTSVAWDATLKILLNLESSPITSPSRILILGHLDYSKASQKFKLLEKNSKKDILKARTKVDKIDQKVSHLVYQIVRAGKTPIIIGGGQNNAYGIIKGTSLALNERVNAINLDSFTGFKPEEGRHSGNGYSYSYAERFLKKYFMFGLQKSKNSRKVFKTINKLKHISYNTYEALFHEKTKFFEEELKRAAKHIRSSSFGISINCGAIETDSRGLSELKARNIVSSLSKHKNVRFLFIADSSNEKQDISQLSDLSVNLIADFIKS